MPGSSSEARDRLAAMLASDNISDDDVKGPPPPAASNPKPAAGKPGAPPPPPASKAAKPNRRESPDVHDDDFPSNSSDLREALDGKDRGRRGGQRRGRETNGRDIDRNDKGRDRRRRRSRSYSEDTFHEYERLKDLAERYKEQLADLAPNLNAVRSQYDHQRDEIAELRELIDRLQRGTGHASRYPPRAAPPPRDARPGSPTRDAYPSRGAEPWGGSRGGGRGLRGGRGEGSAPGGYGRARGTSPERPAGRGGSNPRLRHSTTGAAPATVGSSWGASREDREWLRTNEELQTKLEVANEQVIALSARVRLLERERDELKEETSRHKAGADDAVFEAKQLVHTMRKRVADRHYRPPNYEDVKAKYLKYKNLCVKYVEVMRSYERENAALKEHLRAVSQKFFTTNYTKDELASMRKTHNATYGAPAEEPSPELAR